MTPVVAAIGSTALYLLFGWLLSAIVCGYLAARKGYEERNGLATGLLLLPLGIIVWLVVPAREGSDWKALGPVGRRPKRAVAEDPAAT